MFVLNYPKIRTSKSARHSRGGRWGWRDI